MSAIGDPAEHSVDTPDFWCPFASPVPEATHALADVMADWAGSFGLVDGARESGWLARWHPEGLVARVYPPCEAADLELAACWFAWLFIVDDCLDIDEPDAAAGMAAAITEILRRDDPDLPGPCAPPAVKAVADLWARTRDPMSPAWRERAAYDFTRCLEGAGWESGNRKAQRTPGLEAFRDARRWCGGTYFCLDLLERFQRFELPDALLHSGPLEALRLYACDYIDWVNDVISCHREAARGDMHNLVLVLQTAQGLTRAQAVKQVAAMANERVRSFLSVEQHVLPDYLTNAAITDRDRSLLSRATTGLKNWMRGSLDWHQATARYRDHTDSAANSLRGRV